MPPSNSMLFRVRTDCRLAVVLRITFTITA